MARQNKLKKTGGLKTNGGLMNKIFKVYMLLMFISCTYDDSGAYIKLCEPMIDNKGDNGYWFVKMPQK